MVRDMALAADHDLARVDAVAPMGVGAEVAPSAVPAEARTLAGAGVDDSRRAHWRRLLSLV